MRSGKATWWNGHVTLWVGAHQGKSPSCKVWWPYHSVSGNYNDFSLPRDLEKRRDQSVIWFYGLESVKVSHHPDKFGGYRHCGSGDITFLVAKEEDFRCSHFNPPLLFISKGHGCLHALETTIGQKFVYDFCQSVQERRRKGKEKLKWQLQSFLR